VRKKSPPPWEKERWRFIWALPSDEYHKKERIGVTAVARELSLYESQLYNGLSKQQNQQASSERKLEISTEIARLKRQLAERNEELVILQKAAAYFAKRQKLKYVFIEKHHAEFSIKAMCNVVLAAFTRSKQRYDAPRLTDVLRAQGYYFNVKTVAASLRRQGLRAKASRKFKPGQLPRTRPACVRKSVGAGFLRQWPEPEVAGDITYLRTDEGWLYLAVVIDLWSRGVIGWSMSPRMTAQLACDALQMALWRRKRPRNVIVHTDRGGQYCSADYQACHERCNSDPHPTPEIRSRG